MSYFFFDESIHPKGGFIVGAFVCTEREPTKMLRTALQDAGIQPGIDEYKSGAHVGRDPRQILARDGIDGVVGALARIALMVTPLVTPDILGEEALAALRIFLDANGLAQRSHHVYLDQGIFSRPTRAFELAAGIGIPARCTLHPEMDSRVVLGIQMADLVAHRTATMLLQELGVITKTVKAGDNSGYDADMDIDLGFELWAGLRRSFFVQPFDPDSDAYEEVPYPVVKVEPFGLYVSPLCGPALSHHVRERFGSMYLGCIH